MACLANNQRMVDLAKKFDAELTFDFGSVVGEVETAHPTPMSLWRELVADSHGFATAWTGRMLNIHPSLLPLFKGLKPQQQALDAGVTESGCTVHWVIPDLDDGPTILQRRVPVLPGDTAETLAARILVEEHKAYPDALAMVARGEVSL